MKLFGRDRNKGNESTVESIELIDLNTEKETTIMESEEAVELSETTESQGLLELQGLDGTEGLVEPSETTESQGLIEESYQSIVEDTSPCKTDEEKSLEELDREVEEEVRRFALLSVEEDNQELEEPEESIESIEEIKKKKPIGKLIIRTIMGILGMVLLVYLVGVVFFHYNFFYNTTMNGTHVSFKTVNGVHSSLEEVVNNYTLTMITSDDKKEIISGNVINMGYKESEDVATALDLQMAYKWPIMFFKAREFKVDVEITFNEDILVETLEAMEFANPEESIQPVNAYPLYEDGNVVVVDHAYGNNLVENIGDILIEAVYNLEDEVVLMEVHAYVAPTYTRESQEVIDATEKMATYLESEIIYNEGDTINSEQIGAWINVDLETLEVGLDTSKVEAFVKELESKYNTYSNSISFTNPVGKKVTVSGGSYGFRVNKTTESEQILTDVKSGESVSREIKYSQKGSSTSSASNPFGDSYICLDLTLQKVYVLHEGSVVLTSDVVTGNVANGNATPQGVYSLTYKTKDAVLRGTRYADGSYSYESPVSYWMPFNGGIGFHDASWRSTYGGTIYKTNGSHGCVNMPLENAAKLYEYINSSTPIVCHY